MKTLILKDFRLFFSGGSFKKKFLALTVKLLFTLVFVAILLFMLISILNKIKVYDYAEQAFMSFALFVISVILMLSFTIRANKLFFNKNDIELTSKFPIRNRDIIISKLIFLFGNYFVVCFLFTYPLFVAYGLITKASIGFYFITMLYPLITFFYDMGISLILLCPYTVVKNKLKNHFVMRFICYLVILGIATYLYSRVLNVYVNLVAGGDILTLFTQDTINTFKDFMSFELPASPFIKTIVDKKYNNLLFILVNFIVFFLGVFISTLFYKQNKNALVVTKPKKINDNFKNESLKVTLIKKEFSILTKNDNYIISFMCLLIIQPFLAYLIINSLNLIFRTGTFSYYISVVPNFITILDILLLILFTLIINQGATNYIQMEEKTITIMKMIPVKYKMQLLIKMIIPFTLSFLSFFITGLVLTISGGISLEIYLVSLVLVTLVLFIYDSICLYEELKIRSNKPRNTFTSNLYSYILPIIFFIVSVVLACLSVNIYLIYILATLLMLALGIYFIIDIFKNMEKNFILIESVRKKYN
ncbi:MAG: hypothetical protein J6Y28_02275 [Acholeplasmatales bacterium]|nr:hypothetical protein [Acholeplasmatales bacterium]